MNAMAESVMIEQFAKSQQDSSSTNFWSKQILGTDTAVSPKDIYMQFRMDDIVFLFFTFFSVFVHNQKIFLIFLLVTGSFPEQGPYTKCCKPSVY
jgi:hypothetical protein